jgi:hypothetical protein
MRSCSDFAEKPPNTTECVAPIRAHACIAATPLDRHRHVDDDAVALLHAERLESVGEPAHALVKIAIGDVRDLAIVGLENDGDLVRVAVLEIPVEAVVRDVQLAVREPLVVRRAAFVERLRERLSPCQVLAREIGPEPLEVSGGLRVHRLPVGLLHVRLGHEGLRRLEHALFLHDGLDRRHCNLLRRQRCRGRPASSRQPALWGKSTEGASARQRTRRKQVAMIKSSVSRRLPPPP